jgi:hypothetical protein
MSGESDGEFLARLGTDGDLWAREFMARVLPPDVLGGIPVRDRPDLGTVRAWFANAIEAGRSAGQAPWVGGMHGMDSPVEVVPDPAYLVERVVVTNDGWAQADAEVEGWAVTRRADGAVVYLSLSEDAARAVASKVTP